MTNEFILKCGKCGTEAKASGYEPVGNINGTLINVSINLNDYDPEDIEIEINCEKCGNRIYIK